MATLLTVFYLYGSLRGVYNLMYPMNSVDVSSFPSNQIVHPYWQNNNNNGNYKKNAAPALGMKVYLSTHDTFNADFLIDEFQLKQARNGDSNQQQQQQQQLPRKRSPTHDSILLWEETSIPSSSLSKSFILTTLSGDDESNQQQSSSYQFAVQTLNDADQKESLMNGETGISGSGNDAVVNALLSNAGEGIETTSIILSLYVGIQKAIRRVLNGQSGGGGDNDDVMEDKLRQEREKNRTILPISKSSSIWAHLMNNSTVNVHVILTRNSANEKSASNYNADFQQTLNNLKSKQSSYNLLSGGTNAVKYDLPHHISKPKRYLYQDALYIICKYILRTIDKEEPAPWNMEYTKPEDYQVYQSSLTQKEKGIGYPYWKPEMAVKLVSDDTHYPLDYIGASGMEVIRVNTRKTKGHESGYAYLPGLYVDEMGLTSEKYIPLNETVDSLPLRISFDSGLNYDEDGNEKSESASNSGGLSPGRWRLLTHLSKVLEDQKDFGFDQSDIDDVRRLIADTNVTLLAITIFASTLHLLFEFLTFKNDVEFWRGNKDLTGLSVRALFMDFFSQFIILMFLIERESSLLMTIPAAAGCLIALWKCQKGAGFKFVKITKKDESQRKISVWNKFFCLFGYELHAMRLRAAAEMTDNIDRPDSEKDLVTLTEEMDSLATRTIGKYLLLPIVLGYTIHTIVNEEHSGWYSWFITSASAVVYAIGFVMMTPQLFRK